MHRTEYRNCLASSFALGSYELLERMEHGVSFDLQAVRCLCFDLVLWGVSWRSPYRGWGLVMLQGGVVISRARWSIITSMRLLVFVRTDQVAK
jgi:hypothetical protein